MNVTLQEITSDNWMQAIKLKVDSSQENFVATNVFSIAQSKVEPYWVTRAIYEDQTMVGFLMYGLEMEGNDLDGYWICRLMIDKGYQGKGYGKTAMQIVIDVIKETRADKIFISFEPENATAEKLYEGLGFYDTGHIEDGEKVYRIDLSYE